MVATTVDVSTSPDGTLVIHPRHLGDDHQVAVYFDHSPAAVADLLTAAGVARHRLRYGTR